MVKLPPSKRAPTKAAPAQAATPAAPTHGEKYSLSDLQNDICTKLPLVSRATVDRIVTTAFEELSRNFLLGKVVNIKDFGKFEIKDRPERQGRNPATGEAVTIAAKRVPKFSFAKRLKEAAK